MSQLWRSFGCCCSCNSTWCWYLSILGAGNRLRSCNWQLKRTSGSFYPAASYQLHMLQLHSHSLTTNNTTCWKCFWPQNNIWPLKPFVAHKIRQFFHSRLLGCIGKIKANSNSNLSKLGILNIHFSLLKLTDSHSVSRWMEAVFLLSSDVGFNIHKHLFRFVLYHHYNFPDSKMMQLHYLCLNNSPKPKILNSPLQENTDKQKILTSKKLQPEKCVIFAC